MDVQRSPELLSCFPSAELGLQRFPDLLSCFPSCIDAPVGILPAGALNRPFPATSAIGARRYAAAILARHDALNPRRNGRRMRLFRSIVSEPEFSIQDRVSRNNQPEKLSLKNLPPLSCPMRIEERTAGFVNRSAKVGHLIAQVVKGWQPLPCRSFLRFLHACLPQSIAKNSSSLRRRSFRVTSPARRCFHSALWVGRPQ